LGTKLLKIGAYLFQTNERVVSRKHVQDHAAGVRSAQALTPASGWNIAANTSISFTSLQKLVSHLEGEKRALLS